MTAAKTGGSTEADAPTPDALSEVHGLLSRCFEQPDDDTADAIRSGRLVDALRDRLADLGIETEAPAVPDQPRTAYLRTFDGFEGQYAPPAESVYEPWWDGTERGILSGPAAHDMEARYDAIDAEIPPEYPPDHVALLLEYSSLLLERGATDAYVRFHDEHFDWIPAFRERVERTSDIPMYTWAVRTLETVLDLTADRIDGSGSAGGDRP